MWGQTWPDQSSRLISKQIHNLVKDGNEKMVLNIQFLYENRSLPVFHRSFVGHSCINGLEKREEWCAGRVPYRYQAAHSSTNRDLLRELQLISHSKGLNCTVEDKAQSWQVYRIVGNGGEDGWGGKQPQPYEYSMDSGWAVTTTGKDLAFNRDIYKKMTI